MKHFLLFALLLFGIKSPAQSGWYTVPGAPSSIRFEDVTFVGHTGWIAELIYANPAIAIIYKTYDDGNTWIVTDTITPGGAYPMARSLEFINDSIGIVGFLPFGLDTDYPIYRTTDGGNTFNPVISPALPPNSDMGVCGLAHFGNTIIGVGRYDGERHFYKSTDAGVTWTVQTIDVDTISGLVDCHIFNDSIYIASGTYVDMGIQKAAIIKSFDGGNTWTRVALTDSASGWGWKLHFRENGVGTCSIEQSRYLFTTSDSGSTWNEIYIGGCFNGPLEYGGAGFINDTLGWSAEQWGTCWAETYDGGITWHHFNFGENIDRMVKLDSVTMLAVGQRIYKFSFDSMTVTNVATPERVSLAALKIKPNPADDRITVDLNLQRGMRTHLRLIDANARIIKDLPAEYLTTGNYTRQFNTATLPRGNYFVMLITDLEHLVEKVEVAH